MKRDLEYLECSCTSAEHTVRFTFDDGSWDDCCPEIYIDVQLNRFHGFWGRLWRGIKYIFGYECRYGHWDETLLLGDQVRQLRAICDKHLEAWDKWEAARKEKWEKARGSAKAARNP